MPLIIIILKPNLDQEHLDIHNPIVLTFQWSSLFMVNYLHAQLLENHLIGPS